MINTLLRLSLSAKNRISGDVANDSILMGRLSDKYKYLEHWPTHWPESRIALMPLIVKLCRKAYVYECVLPAVLNFPIGLSVLA